MKDPVPIRAKLITAAMAFALVFGFSLFNISTFSASARAFQIAIMLFATFLAFFGVFGNPSLQLLWGWGLAISTPLLVGLSIFVFRGPLLIWGLLATLAAAVGGYLLLADASVRNYREQIRKKTTV